ncbi:MAG: hypothetical protein CO106_00690 [Deltaproteobacteria bacterium CG_4_9_14_3_um_filter_44_9]|nr:MAG: hypothetical protein COY50_10615 [Deltaproteobacteria bacterium CG_4_10_14_0_8_um_filter_43_12]PJB46128.1 MAG: hypothetical protein CO106_00690 [Deltaproteobacteria bacterium CG_4_9_14_3_um_filter_44_9]
MNVKRTTDEEHMNSISDVSDVKNNNAPHFIDPVQGDRMLGAFRAACGIRGALVLVHAPVGCHWGVNYMERLSSIRTSGTVSALRERSVVFGGEDSLRKTIEIILKNRKKRYLILLAGSVPSIIGEDWQGVIDSVGFDFHSIALDCGGYLGKMGEGYDACLCELSQWMDDPAAGRSGSAPKVNLIGLQRDIARGEADIKEIRRALGLIGIGVHSVFPPASIKELKKAPEADLNIVFGYGRDLAIRMEQKWGVPSVVFMEYPYGLAGTRDLVRSIGERLGVDSGLMKKRIQGEEKRMLDIIKRAHLYLPALYGLPAAVSADLPQAIGLARFLSTELGMDMRGIHIVSSPGRVQGETGLEHICPDILFDASWEEFESLVERTDPGLILGSDLERRICNRERPLILISYPTMTRITLTAHPYMGFRGVLTLIEEIVNNV